MMFPDDDDIPDSIMPDIVEPEFSDPFEDTLDNADGFVRRKSGLLISPDIVDPWESEEDEDWEPQDGYEED